MKTNPLSCPPTNPSTTGTASGLQTKIQNKLSFSFFLHLLKILRPWIMTVLMLCFFGSAQCLLTHLSEVSAVEIILENELTYPDIQQITQAEEEEDTPLSFGLWEEGKCLVENKSLERQTSISFLKIYGDSELILPEHAVEGNISLKEGDTEGCLLDKKTAETLFGNQNVAGNTIELDGKPFIIRGLLSQIENCVVVQAVNGAPMTSSQDSSFQNTTSPLEASFHHLILHFPKNEDAGIGAEDFLSRHGLSGSVLCDINWIQSMGRILSLCLPFLLMFFMMKSYIKLLCDFRNYPFIYYGILFIFIVLCLGFFWLLHLKLTFPQSMIPTSWSDFSFWPEYLEKQKDDFFLLITSSKNSIQAQMVTRLLQLSTYGLLSILCFPFSICPYICSKKKPQNHMSLYMYCCTTLLLSWITFFIFICVNPDLHSVLANQQKLWFLLPYYVFCMKISEKISHIKTSIYKQDKK